MKRKETSAFKEILERQHNFDMMYLQLIGRKHKLHLSINLNDFDFRLHFWREIVSLCFATNKQNYARYGACYCVQLENLDRTYPGAEEELQNRGLYVCRNNINVRQSIDGPCEQTFMKSSKTAGGIKNFIKQDSTHEKWVLTGSFQAKYMDALLTYSKTPQRRT